ncbi:hypothetical protein JCM18909_1911 [Cutibacterium acnes JCM 18909]|nr:hypothetical protein JCM18909_1911 [Cutibacterium acnes JCM 18909]
MVDDATHVANAVSVRVGEAAWVDLVDDSGLPLHQSLIVGEVVMGSLWGCVG